MKKLNLKLDALEVETFEVVGGEPGQRGTVHGHGPTWHYNGCTPYEPCNPISGTDYTVDYTCDDDTCYETCGNSCNGTCYDSCNCDTMWNTCAETCQQTVPC